MVKQQSEYYFERVEEGINKRLAQFFFQRDEFKTAEQMLHIALKLAQEQQNEDGITYIYDLMANLAFAQGEFNKAERLFVQVGVIHISKI